MTYIYIYVYTYYKEHLTGDLIALQAKSPQAKNLWWTYASYYYYYATVLYAIMVIYVKILLLCIMQLSVLL